MYVCIYIYISYADFKGIAACESRFGGHGSGHRPWRISRIYLAHQRFMGKQSCGVCSTDLLLGCCVPSRKPVPGPMKFAVNQRRSMSLPSFKSKFQFSTDSIQFFLCFLKTLRYQGSSCEISTWRPEKHHVCADNW